MRKKPGPAKQFPVKFSLNLSLEDYQFLTRQPMRKSAYIRQLIAEKKEKK